MSYVANAALALEPEEALDQRPRFVLLEGGLANKPSASRAEQAPVPATLNLRQKAAAALFAILVASLLAFALEATASGAAAAREEAFASMPVETVTVHDGDTLWQIASERVPDGVDARDVVAWIEERNGLDGGLVFAGQELVVPVAAD